MRTTDKAKDKVISFRVDSESFKKLEEMSKTLGAGTAHNFVRALAQTVANTAGAVDMWRVEHEPEQK